MLGKRRKLGKSSNEIEVGETFTLSLSVRDRDLLIFLGLTDDSNPLYLQHDYASQTPFKSPVVPTSMVFGMVSSLISMHLPGPGSHIIQQQLTYPHPVYHYAKVTFKLEVTELNKEKHTVSIYVNGVNEEGKQVISGDLLVQLPYEPQSLNAISLDNFY